MRVIYKTITVLVAGTFLSGKIDRCSHLFLSQGSRREEQH